MLRNEETQDIVAFLESLTGNFPAQTMPKLPPTPHEVVWDWQQTQSSEKSMHADNGRSAQP